MVEFNDGYYGAARPSRSIGRWTRRLIGAACVLALPGLWLSTSGALPEARVLGLAISIVLIGVAGLCFLGARKG